MIYVSPPSITLSISTTKTFFKKKNLEEEVAAFVFFKYFVLQFQITITCKWSEEAPHHCNISITHVFRSLANIQSPEFWTNSFVWAITHSKLSSFLWSYRFQFSNIIIALFHEVLPVQNFVCNQIHSALYTNMQCRKSAKVKGNALSMTPYSFPNGEKCELIEAHASKYASQIVDVDGGRWTLVSAMGGSNRKD